MKDLKEKIEEIIEKYVYAEDGVIIAKSHAVDQIIKLIQDNYVPKEKIVVEKVNL